MLCQIWITYLNFKTFKKYLRELECAQTERQTECINTFQLCWKVLKMRKECTATFYRKNAFIKVFLIFFLFCLIKVGLFRAKKKYFFENNRFLISVNHELDFARPTNCRVKKATWNGWISAILNFLTILMFFFFMLIY